MGAIFRTLGKISLPKQILIGLILGFVVGFSFGPQVAFLKILGDIFIKLIRMIIVPLTFIIITEAFMSMSNVGRMGKVALKCIVLYILTTAIAVAFGIFVAEFIKPGAGIALTPDFFAQSDYTAPPAREITFAKMITDIFPSNLFQSFLNGDIVQILVFAAFFGIAINRISSESAAVSGVISAMSKVIMKIVDMVIKFTPFGVFGIIAYLSGTQELKTLQSLFVLILCVYGSIFFLGYVFYGLVLGGFGLNPFTFFKKVFQIQYFAFLTASSASTIPLTKITCEKKLGVTPETAGLAVPLGATFNMNGTAVHLGITAIFLSQLYGADLTFMHYAKVIFLSIILTVGVAGIPGASVLAMPMILASIGTPVEYIAVYIGIDRFLDMGRSTLNVAGDALVATIIDKSEGTLDKDIYNSTEPVDVFTAHEESKKDA